MTDKEVLQKALKIAVKNGFRWNTMMPKVIRVSPNLELLIDLEGKTQVSIGSSDLIFSHDFAKAFWGESEDKIKTTHNKNIYDGNRVEIHCKDIYIWQHHLQQMVLCDNPIDYLRKHIEK
jgi:hypothetical protein